MEWTLDSNKDRGIADGFLKLNEQAVDTDVVGPLQDDYKKVAEDFPVIAIWEFKNMLAGSKEVFELIVQQAGDEEFSWEGCEHGMRCPIVHPGKDGGPMVTGSRTALDAETPICKSTPPEDITPASWQSSEVAKRHARHMTQQVNIIRPFTRLWFHDTCRHGPKL
jgi:hypothetical protein